MKEQTKIVQDNPNLETVKPKPTTHVKTISTQRTTSMKSYAINKNSDGTIQLTIFGDISHGDRTFTFDQKDATIIANTITMFTTQPR